jgi:hypothetical protein
LQNVEWRAIKEMKTSREELGMIDTNAVMKSYHKDWLVHLRSVLVSQNYSINFSRRRKMPVTPNRRSKLLVFILVLVTGQELNP